MRTALWLLALLAVAAIPGSLLPQRPSDPWAVTRYVRDHPQLARWWDRLWLFEVYSSPWFQAIYLLLMVSLVGCLVPRARRWAIQVRQPPTLPTQRGLLASQQQVLGCQLTPEKASKQVQKWLRSKRYRLRREENWPATDGQSGTLVAADKGRLREVGNLSFHLALLGILVAVALGYQYGYRADVVVAEGGGFTNSVAQYDFYRPGPGVQAQDLPPFTLTLRELQVSFRDGGHDTGAPEGFAAQATVRDAPGDQERHVKIGPNAPLDIDGTKVYLMGQGYAPRVTVRDGQGRLAFSGPVVLLPAEGDRTMTSPGVLKVPDAQPDQLGLRLSFLPTGLRLPTPEGGSRLVSVFPEANRPVLVVEQVWRGDLGLSTGVPQSVYQLDTRSMRQVQGSNGQPVSGEMIPGTTLQLPDGLGSLTFDGVSRFAGFSLHSDPGRGWALGAAMLALLGLCVSLFVHPRTVWVLVQAGPAGGSVLALAGQTARGQEQLRDQLHHLAMWLGKDEPGAAGAKGRSS